jgi:hypothetical protein
VTSCARNLVWNNIKIILKAVGLVHVHFKVKKQSVLMSIRNAKECTSKLSLLVQIMPFQSLYMRQKGGRKEGERWRWRKRKKAKENCLLPQNFTTIFCDIKSTGDERFLQNYT